MGLEKGWLSPDSGEHFKSELDRLSGLETEATAHNWEKPYLDNVEKQFTQYNIDFTKATNAPGVVGNGPPVGPGPAVGPAHVGTPVVGPAHVVAKTKVTKHAVKTSIKSKTKVSTKATIKH